ncbi:MULTISPECIES: chromate transporter [Massilia]|uniref:Chromate transporter n=1 Tax=Massilia aurea TaxID=373040 RepID=A0A422QMZ6_9BURK|nr:MULTISPECIES: chromate transporter [Massilia]MDY0960841.1 chromate transporter [Massilia sp. CFBP9026]RNF31367.1 chromate transporter [Massilia aurea]
MSASPLPLPPSAPRSAQAAPPAEPDRPRPTSLTDLFVSFTLIALQGFGGVLAVIQQQVVERKRWMSNEEFIEEWSVAQIMPGPNVCNLAMMIGTRHFGLAGAMSALAGILTVPLILVLCLALVYAQFATQPQLQGALRGMAAVAAGLIAATGLRMSVALSKNVIPLAVCIGIAATGFVLLAWIRVPLAAVIGLLGGLGCVLAWRRLKP